MALLIVISVTACNKNEELPLSPPDLTERTELNLPVDNERERLVKLYENPSVLRAIIETNGMESPYDIEYYNIDLAQGIASIRDSSGISTDYLLDETDIVELSRLLSEYALIVYDNRPYWPSVDYCTMIELFDYTVSYKESYYREYGATHYPEVWDEFIQKMRQLITARSLQTVVLAADD